MFHKHPRNGGVMRKNERIKASASQTYFILATEFIMETSTMK